jgi:hypothetical protein
MLKRVMQASKEMLKSRKHVLARDSWTTRRILVLPPLLQPFVCVGSFCWLYSIKLLLRDW